MGAVPSISRSLLDDLNKNRSDNTGTRRVLTSDEIAIPAADDRLHTEEVVRLDIFGPILLQVVLEKERHEFGVIVGILLCVGETCHCLAGDQVGAVLELDVDESGGAVAHGGHDLVCAVKLADQLVGGSVVCEIEHCWRGEGQHGQNDGSL